ncbi:MAG TPA: hypothetical protein VMG08_06955 [Allosphingosinicella sp.]|nr:hypothetical protein [Allosphingosinicella sp.]
MTDGGETLLSVAVLLAGVAMLSFVMLRGWEGWLRLRRLELEQARGPGLPAAAAGRRLELIDLKDRVKRLEAICDGADGCA